jgi:four helix bundle protein
LLAWKKAVDLVENIYVVTAFLPKEELYGLVSQMRRAAVSVPSNIAEGSSRAISKDFLRLLNIATSSCAELDAQLEIVRRMGWLSDIERTQSMLNELTAIVIGRFHLIWVTLSRLSAMLRINAKLPTHHFFDS